jgi:type III secretion system YscD/HrpQ family protein
MAGYLIAEEGPLSGLTVRFEEGNEWILGRDPDVAALVLEDPMVSRKHVICRLTPEGYVLENLSSVNPATQNGKLITEPVLLREGDIIQIGNTFFRFTEKMPAAESREVIEDFPEDLATAQIDLSGDGKWLMKVISGPNAGAEFSMHKSSSYIIGKDPNVCDIVFQDLSVSRQHARLTVDEQENVFIEDMGSRNGVLVNGQLITGKQFVSSEDLIALGTTSFLIIDRHQAPETIFSPATGQRAEEEIPSGKEASALEKKPVEMREWREMIIPRRHLAIAGVLAGVVLITFLTMISLFKSEPVVVHERDESEKIKEKIHNYTDLQFSYNPASGKLFLVGHVLTPVDKQELLYLLHTLPFVQSIDDNVVIDEYVWQNMNALLITNPEWQGITVQSPASGKFIMKGYLQTLEQAQLLSDYMSMNFPYLDRLENQVVIESDLNTQIASMLVAKGFGGVTFQLANGEVVLAGRVDEKTSHAFNDITHEIKGLRGIRVVKNFVIVTTEDTSRMDLSTQYQVSGVSKKDDSNYFVVINGKILSPGDNLDGMIITGVEPNMVLLEKDGLKFKINYNLQ